jgi:RimJ/RimL family protein N-acetyltransferase
MTPGRDGGRTGTIDRVGPGPEALARDPEVRVTLRDGASIRVRPIRPDDEERLLALCRRLSPQTVYQRFFSFRRLPPEEAHAFANVDYRQRMAVVAEVVDAQTPTLIGVARYGPSEDGTADIGLIVEDRWQGLGLGSLLLEQILAAGERRGIDWFSADVLADNRRALRLLARHTAITRRVTSDGVTSLVFRRAAASAEATTPRVA